MIEQLQEQIGVVARARTFAAKAKLAVNESRIGWEAQNAAIIDNADRAAEFTQEEEARLRELTLQAYAETGDKGPAVGVSVKIFEVLNYDSDEAKKWAVEHRVALKLDTATFEKIAKVDKPSFVTMSEEPRAQIARNLGME